MPRAENLADDNPLRQRVARLLRLRRAVTLVWQAAPGWAVASALLVLLQGAVPLLGLVLLKLVVDSITAALSAPEPLAARPTPLVYVALVGALGLLASALQAVTGLVNEALSGHLTDHVQGLIHRKSVALDLEYFETPEYYDHLHRAQREGAHRPLRIVTGLVGLGRDGLSLAAVTGLLLLFKPWIVLLVAVAAVPGLLGKLRRSAELYRWRLSRTPTERLAMLLDWMLTHVTFAKELRLFGLGEHLSERHRQLRATLRRERMDLARRRAVGEVLAQSVRAVALVVALAMIIYDAARGLITLGDVVMYFQALQRGLGFLQQLFSNLAGLYEDSLFLANLEEFLNQRPRLADPEKPKPLLRPLPEGIVFEHVSFRYPGSKQPALRDVSLVIQPGQVAAVVGRNGAGKTTLVKLLCRLYDPEEGRILLGGEDLRSYGLRDLRRAIGVIFQDFAHFPASARENIGFGDVERAFEEATIAGAARRSGAHEVLEALPEGYDTLLGNWFTGGHELSVGEWQRVALARTYFRDAEVVVLDEPTSSLDPLAEAGLFERLRELLNGRTALFISQRFSGVRAADRVFVMDGGSVSESGSHEELMKLDGLYARLFRTQASRYQ